MISSKLSMTIAACLFCWQVGVVPAQEATPPDPVGTAASKAGEAAEQVNVFRLRHSDAAAIVKELASFADSKELRMVADKRTNGVIVVAPPAIQKAVGSLLSKLDVPPARNDTPSSDSPSAAGQPVEVRAIHVADARASLVAKAVGAIEPSSHNSLAHTTFAVAKASPATQKVLENLAATLGGNSQTGRDKKAGIKVLYIPAADVTLLAEALAHRSDVRGGHPGIVVISPSPTTTRETQELGADRGSESVSRTR